MVTVSGVFTGQGVAPSVVSASMRGNVVTVAYSEPMDPVTMREKSNYSIPGMIILRADIVPRSNNTKVALTVTGFLPATLYTVTVTGVTDVAGNEVQAESQTIVCTGIASTGAFGTTQLTQGAAAYFYDTFTRADNTNITAGGAPSTPDIGALWTYVSNDNWGISSGKLYKTGTSVDSFLSANGGISDNFTIEITVSTLSGTQDWGLCFRRPSYSGASEGYFMHFDGSFMSFYRHTNAPSFTQLSTVAGTPIAGDIIKVKVIGNDFTAYKNEVQILTANDSTYTGQGIGMYTGAAQNNHRWDNIRVAAI